MARTEIKREILLQKYELGKLLGQGTFAKVHHARHITTSQSVAIKILDKKTIIRAGMMDQIKREISIMRLVKHPNIILLHEVLATKSKIFFVMEYAKNGELFSKLARGRLPEPTARKLFHQLIQAVHFCHLRGVFHRDLKPENLLLDDNFNLKVSDFGLSALSDSSRRDGLLHTACGTPSYVAPEVILMNGYDGATSDIWSCGVILFVLLSGYLPFHDRNLMELYRKITRAEFKFPAGFSSELRYLLSRMLEPDPSARISMTGVMETEWFLNGGGVTEGKKAMGTVALARRVTAFEIIASAPGLDLSGMFEAGGKAEARWFVARAGAGAVVARLEAVAEEARLKVGKKEDGVVRMEGKAVAIDAEIFEVQSGLLLVQLMLAGGDPAEYRRLWSRSLSPSLQEIVSV
ncbi:CBL-interacting protein kinase 18-like [Wolffia australiana]